MSLVKKLTPTFTSPPHRVRDPRALHALVLVCGSLNTFHYNTILRAYVDSSNFHQAVHLFDHSVFRRPRFVPDNYTCPIILKACSGLCSLEFGRRVHDFIRHHAHFKPNVYTKCALVDMFAKCGSLDDARVVFDEMPHRERDLASWTAIICGSISWGWEAEALRLFEMMTRGGIRPDSALVAAVLPACGRLGARRAGTALQGCAWKSGFHGDLFVSNAIMDMYCKFGDAPRAHSVFCRMSRKDDVSWRTLISGYSHNCQFVRSLDLYSEMMSSDGKVKPSAVVAASVLPAIGKLNLSKEGKGMHGFIIKQGFDRDIVVGIALMDMYSSCGLFGEMEILLSVWSDWDIAIWNSAIVGHASGENLDLSLGVFRRMWESELKPNPVTLVSILPLCTKMGALKQGMEVHCYAIKNRHAAMAVSVSNSLIDMYCKCGHLGLGFKVFDQMMEKKDIVSYNTIISAYGFYGYAKQALILFEEMRTLDMDPTNATFVGLLSACSHAGLLDEGWSLYRSMIGDYGLQPNMEHYSCMVDLLGRAGRIGDACDFIRSMPEGPDGNVLGCLLAACQVHCVTEPVDLLEEILREKPLEDSGYLILVSNMYASKKKWKDASRVRALIKEKGLRKKPGHSWIQIGHCTHVFDARDTTHSDFCKIQRILEILLSEMKEEESLQLDNIFKLSILGNLF